MMNDDGLQLVLSSSDDDEDSSVSHSGIDLTCNASVYLDESSPVSVTSTQAYEVSQEVVENSSEQAIGGGDEDATNLTTERNNNTSSLRGPVVQLSTQDFLSLGIITSSHVGSCSDDLAAGNIEKGALTGEEIETLDTSSNIYETKREDEVDEGKNESNHSRSIECVEGISSTQAQSRLSRLLKSLAGRITPRKEETDDHHHSDDSGEKQISHAEVLRKEGRNRLTRRKKKAVRKEVSKVSVEKSANDEYSQDGVEPGILFVPICNDEENVDEIQTDWDIMDIKPDPLTLLVKPCSVRMEKVGLTDTDIGDREFPEDDNNGEGEKNEIMNESQIELDTGNNVQRKLTLRKKTRSETAATDFNATVTSIGVNNTVNKTKRGRNLGQSGHRTCPSPEFKSKLSLRRSKRDSTRVDTLASSNAHIPWKSRAKVKSSVHHSPAGPTTMICKERIQHKRTNGLSKKRAIDCLGGKKTPKGDLHKRVVYNVVDDKFVNGEGGEYKEQGVLNDEEVMNLGAEKQELNGPRHKPVVVENIYSELKKMCDSSDCTILGVIEDEESTLRRIFDNSRDESGGIVGVTESLVTLGENNVKDGQIGGRKDSENIRLIERNPTEKYITHKDLDETSQDESNPERTQSVSEASDMEHGEGESAIEDPEQKVEGLINLNDTATNEYGVNDLRNTDDVEIVCECDSEVDINRGTVKPGQSRVRVVKISPRYQFLSPSPTTEGVNEFFDEWQGSCKESLDEEDFSFEECSEVNNNRVEAVFNGESKESGNQIRISSRNNKLGKGVHSKLSNSSVESLVNFFFESIHDALYSTGNGEELISSSQEINNNAYNVSTESDEIPGVSKPNDSVASPDLGVDRKNELQEEEEGQTVESTEEPQIEEKVESLSQYTNEVKPTLKDSVLIHDAYPHSLMSRNVSTAYPVEDDHLTPVCETFNTADVHTEACPPTIERLDPEDDTWTSAEQKISGPLESMPSLKFLREIPESLDETENLPNSQCLDKEYDLSEGYDDEASLTLLNGTKGELPDLGSSMLFEDTLIMVSNDLNLSSDSGEDVVLKPRKYEEDINEKAEEYEEKTVESTMSPSLSADPTISKDSNSNVEVEVVSTNQLDLPKEVEVTSDLCEKTASSRIRSSTKRSLFDISSEDENQLNRTNKKRIVHCESYCQSVVERLAQDIINKAAQLSASSNPSSSSRVTSNISPQSPSITSSTGPHCLLVTSPLPVGNDDESDFDSSDDDGVVIIEETGVDKIPSFRTPSDVKVTNIAASNLNRVFEAGNDGVQKTVDPKPSRSLVEKEVRQETNDVKPIVCKRKPGPMSMIQEGPVFPNKKKTRCRTCGPCRATDCGECVYCLDKLKFGGPNKRKNACIQRRCSNMIPEKIQKLEGGLKSGDCKPAAASSSKIKSTIISASYRKSEKDKKKVVSTSSSEFKIPKGPAKFPGYDAHSKDKIKFNGECVSVRRFLKEENVIPNFDGFLNDENWKKVEAMYDKVVNIKKYREVDKEVHGVDDTKELSDIKAQNSEMKNLKNDAERKRDSRLQFNNVVSSDPGNPLSYHGFRRLHASKKPANKVKLFDADSFSISGGQLLPRSGFKRIDGSQLKNDAQEVKKVTFDDHGIIMKKLFVHKYNKKLGVKKAPQDQQEVDYFLTYLAHYKTGQEETGNFLAFYNPRKELKLEQVKEVVDMENQFSTFSTYYGEAEGFFCKDCRKEHKFCQ